MKKIPTALEVVAIALIDPQGRILMQQRPAGKDHAGLWEFPGGKVEPRETDTLALRREVAEELGMDVAAADLDYLCAAEDPRRAIVIRLYTCRIWSGEPQGLDGQETGWFDPDELQALPMPPLDVPLARQLAAMLNSAK